MSENMVPQIAQVLENILSSVADKKARETDFVKRQVKITGANFCQTLIFGWLHKPTATVEELCQMGAAIGLEISPQGLDQRFTTEAACLLRQLLHIVVSQAMQAEPVAIPLLQRFQQVVVEDSSVVTLPNEVAERWPGCGGSGSASSAAVKLQVRWDLLQGQMDGPHLVPGKMHDRQAALEHGALPPGALHIADLGYWKLGRLQQLSEQKVYWLSRLQSQTMLLLPSGTWTTQAHYLTQCQQNQIDLAVHLGKKKKLPARLLAVRVPTQVAQERRRKLKANARRKGDTVSQERLALADWTILVTNIPADLLSLHEAIVLMRMRWQIELLFKLWKHVGHLDKSRSDNPWRILTEFYAKLIGLIIQHWCFLTSIWRFPNRSLMKAANTVQSHALPIALALSDPFLLRQALATLLRCLAHSSRINRSRKTPRTFQLLLANDFLHA